MQARAAREALAVAQQQVTRRCRAGRGTRSSATRSASARRALMRPGRPNARCSRSVGVDAAADARGRRDRVVDVDPPLELARVVVGHLVGRRCRPTSAGSTRHVALARARDEDAQRERRRRRRGGHDRRRELQTAAHERRREPSGERRARHHADGGRPAHSAGEDNRAGGGELRGSATRAVPCRRGLRHQRLDQRRRRIRLGMPLARRARSGAPGPRSPRAARPARTSRSPTPYLEAEVVHAATHEGALRLEDVLERRTHCAIETADHGLAAAPRAGALLAETLGLGRRQARAGGGGVRGGGFCHSAV